MMKSLVIITVLSLLLPFWVMGQAHTSVFAEPGIAQVVHVSCAGKKSGEAVISLAEPFAPYTLSWASPVDGRQHMLKDISAQLYTIKNLPAGAYDLQISDAAGNDTYAHFVITEPAPLMLETSVIRDATCNGLSNGAATVKVQGGAGGYSYHWMHEPYHTSASVSGLSSGMYVVTVRDQNECEATEAVTIINEESLALETETIINPFTGESAIHAQAINGAGSYTYDWSTGEHTSFIHAQIAGAYTVAVSDSRGCLGKAMTMIEGKGELSLNELQAINESVLIGPVPTDDVVNISVPGLEHSVKVAVMSMNGQQLLIREVAPLSSVSIELGQFPKGSYSLHVISGNMRYPLRQKVLRQ